MPIQILMTSNESRIKVDLDDIDHRTHLTIEFKKIKFNVYVLYNK